MECITCGKNIYQVFTKKEENLDCNMCKKYIEEMSKLSSCEVPGCKSAGLYLFGKGDIVHAYCMFHNDNYYKKPNLCQFVNCGFKHQPVYKCYILKTNISNKDRVYQINDRSLEELSETRPADSCYFHHNISEKICYYKDCPLIATHGRLGEPPKYCSNHKTYDLHFQKPIPLYNKVLGFNRRGQDHTNYFIRKLQYRLRKGSKIPKVAPKKRKRHTDNEIPRKKTNVLDTYDNKIIDNSSDKLEELVTILEKILSKEYMDQILYDNCLTKLLIINTLVAKLGEITNYNILNNPMVKNNYDQTLFRGNQIDNKK